MRLMVAKYKCYHGTNSAMFERNVYAYFFRPKSFSWGHVYFAAVAFDQSREIPELLLTNGANFLEAMNILAKCVVKKTQFLGLWYA